MSLLTQWLNYCVDNNIPATVLEWFIFCNMIKQREREASGIIEIVGETTSEYLGETGYSEYYDIEERRWKEIKSDEEFT